ncbi:DUF777 family protein [Borrelia turcica]|uniref:DUF777 family protein n=1 Tax=Borrelia turcica TaxID=229155 RepID=UPI001EE91745|nr:DUF777 family protein [Borrelia turcica]
MNQTIFICRIGIIKKFEYESQEGNVLSPEFAGLEIKTFSISNIRLDLREGRGVILLQSNYNIFNEYDDNNFDKG